MPLHGRKVIQLVKPLTNVDPNETIFTIPHTQEQFRSKAEYDKRVAQYAKAVWTCQCTGHINMTHKEAYYSEQEKFTILRDQFPHYFERTVLELVHHNTEILDNLVDQAWTRIQQAFAVGETVALKVKVHGKVIRGEVVKVDADVGSPHKNELPNGNCNSPSSDKENAVNNNEDSDSTPTKWVHPKLLEYNYNLKLEGEDRTISGIPAHDLRRVNRPPSKDLVKLFIRSHALRHGSQSNSPWVVSDLHIKNYSLKSKYADFLVSPQKMTVMEKKAPTDTKRKRVSASKDVTSNAKRQKQTQLTLTIPDVTPKKRGRPPKSANSTPVSSPKKPQTPKKSPPKAETKSIVKVALAGSSSSSHESDSDDGLALADLKTGKKSAQSPTAKSKSGLPLKRPLDDTKVLANTKCEPQENTPLAQLFNADGSPKKKRGRPPKPKGPEVVKTPKKRGRPRKSEAGTPNKSPSAVLAKRGRPKKNMKQMTLFDLKGNAKGTAKSPTKATSKSPRKNETPIKLPPIVARLRKLFKLKDNNNKDRNQFFRLLTTTAEKLTKKQQAILPDDIKGVLLNKIAVLDERKKVNKMTPEEKKEYMKQKRKDKAKENAKVEDTYLSDLQQLPRPKLVPSPDGIANELFGDIVMITEFINCYKGLILPEDTRVFNANEAMKSISGDEGSFLYVGQMLQVLLQTLLQDGIAQDYKELGMALANITVTPYGTAELARLCLRDNDNEDDSSGEDEDSEEDWSKHDEVPSELVEQLECNELWSLAPEEKLAVLKGLCHRMMNSYSVQDYMSQCQQTATDLWRKRGGYAKAKNQQMLVKKEEEEEAKGQEPAAEQKPGVTLKDFYGNPVLTNVEPTSDLASIVKRRRVMAVRAVEEKRQRDQVERKRRDKEYEEERKLRELESFEKDFMEGISIAKLVLRQTPIGTDRDHNRYWQFLGAAPGIYVEKGWAPQVMDYQVRNKNHTWNTSESDSDSETEQKARKPRDSGQEKTVPHVGQNLWFYYDNLADIQSLMDRLHPRGVRENNLSAGLKKVYPSIEADFKRAAKSKDKSQHDAEKLASDLIEGMRQDLLDVEMRLRSGGLGGVDNFTDWEANLKKAATLQEFGGLLIETQTYVPGKFMTGFLGPEGMYKKKKAKAGEEEESEEVEEGNEPQEDVHAGIERWKEAINTCSTFSRLHVLLAMLDSCVKWERSMENAKCKVCRRKGDEFLLCDDCNQPFHLYCLRPALPCVPEGDWFCPACLPVTHRKNSRNKDYRRMAEGSDESEEDEDEGSGDSDSDDAESNEAATREVDEECTMCGGDEGLITCSSCPSSFHIDCHNPPLRRPPRSIWKCQQCVTGVRIRKSKSRRPQRTKRSARNTQLYSYEEATSEEESEDEESNEEDASDDDEESEDEEEGSGSEFQAPKKRSKPKKAVEESDDDDSTEEEDESEDGSQPAKKTPSRGRGRRKMAVEESEENDSTEDDEDESEEESEPAKKAPSRGRGRQKKAVEESEDNDSTDDDASEEESQPAKKATPQGRGRLKKAVKESEDNDSTEEDEDESEDESRPAKKAPPHGRDRTKKVVEESESSDSTEEGDEEEEEESDSESTKAAAIAERASDTMMQAFKTIVTRLSRHRCAWPFIDPVDNEEVPDYYKIVTTPICMQDLKVKVEDGDYETPQELLDDVALLFDNADLYNKRDSLVGKCIKPLEKAFITLKNKHFPEYLYRREDAPSPAVQEGMENHYSSDTENSS